jgi:hypothetical protein
MPFGTCLKKLRAGVFGFLDRLCRITSDPTDAKVPILLRCAVQIKGPKQATSFGFRTQVGMIDDMQWLSVLGLNLREEV